MQREELALQRQELKDTRQEFAKQTQIHDSHLALLTAEPEERERLQTLAFEPFLMLRLQNAFPDEVGLILINAGATIFDLQVLNPVSSGQRVMEIGIGKDTILEKGSSTVIALTLSNLQQSPCSYSFDLGFTTGRNERKVAQLTIHVENHTPHPPSIA